MLEEIKNNIEKNKKDKSSIIKYIKAFCETQKANELFSNNDSFKELLKENKNKKTDEYF